MKIVHLVLLQKKTGQCFGLNGAIFLGSILLWDYCLAPGMAWLLAGGPHSYAFWEQFTPECASQQTDRITACCRLGGMVWGQGHGAAAGSAAGAVRPVLAGPGVLHQLRAQLRLVCCAGPCQSSWPLPGTLLIEPVRRSRLWSLGPSGLPLPLLPRQWRHARS